MALPLHPSLDEIDTLTSLDLVMKECLRLVPPVPGMARQSRQGHRGARRTTSPPAAACSIGVHLTHHMPELWPDPERFDPERFADDRREDKVHRYAWEPFGGGVHKCIGLYFGAVEVKMIMHQLLRRFEWSGRPRLRRPHELPLTTVPEGRPAGRPAPASTRIPA